MAGAVRRGDGVYIVHTIDCYRGHRFECRVRRGELSLWRGGGWCIYSTYH